MLAFFVYLLKGIILSGVLVGYYYAGCRNRRFHHYNRVYLLMTVVISVFLPLLPFDWFSLPMLTDPAVFSGMDLLAWIDQRGGTTRLTTFSWERVFFILTIAISAVLTAGLVLRVHRIFSLKKEYKMVHMQDYYFIETDLPQAPFSFFNFLFWKKGMSLRDRPGCLILQHELTHIRQNHSYDKLFSQFIASLFWMNPFYHLIRKELSLVHEFIADGRSINEGDTAVLAEMLLLASGMENCLEPAQAFFQTPVKRRIRMLSLPGKQDVYRFRRLTGVVVIFFTCIMFSYAIPSKPANISPIFIFSGSEKATDTIPQKAKPKSKEWSPEKVHQLVVQIIKDPPDVSFYVNGKETPREEIRKMDPDKITAMNIFKGEDAIKRHGQKAKNGVIEFSTK